MEKWGKQFFKCHNCGLSKTFDQFLKDMDADLYAEYVNQKFPESHVEDAATPLKEEVDAKPPGTQYLPRGGCGDHQFWRRSKKSMPANLHRGEKKGL